jgi:hydroxymethylpyrimidine/phosphomethylpyrimidine kinase
MLRYVALVRTDVSDELSASFIRVTRIGELGTTLAVTSNRRKLRRNSVALVVDPKIASTSEALYFFRNKLVFYGDWLKASRPTLKL